MTKVSEKHKEGNYRKESRKLQQKTEGDNKRSFNLQSNVCDGPLDGVMFKTSLCFEFCTGTQLGEQSVLEGIK